MGEHLGMWLKQSLFEESSRIPFVICAPGKKTGVCTTVVELVDLFSTITELCGLPAPPNQEGSSLVPLLENPGALWKKAVFAQVKRPDGRGGNIMARAVRTNTFHYNSWQGFGEELYDIVNDPYEYTNLYYDSSHLDDLNKMRTLLAGGWQAALPPVYTKKAYFRDADHDRFGNTNDSIVAYFKPNGYIIRKGDCNDNNANIYPGAVEKCNGADDNCNGLIDENKPAPVITPLGDLDICQTGSVVLRTDAGIGFTYQWKKDGVNIAGATNRKYTATEAAGYKVAVTDSTGCTGLSKKVTVTNSCGAIAFNGKILSDATVISAELSLYPNPSRGNINVVYTSSSTGKVQLKVVDMVGKVLFINSEQATKGSNTFRLNLSQLKSGAYYLELNDNTSQKRIKFVIER